MSAAAAKKPVKSPGRPVGQFVVDSLPSRLCALEVGESESRTMRIPLAEATASAITEARKNLSNSTRKATFRAIERTGHEFEAETFAVRSEVSDFMVVLAIITRTA